ncbi:FAD-dependent monooxygenase [Rhodanobacter sp. MP7CTX1]|uniref:FAD-dependent oxidoreductase n=1 Tax=Rhodanobacter sp. MP7CTX1 TaxID=2723084 RepID=UPI00161A7B1A|nr:FAD-dependent monooxygenase [Rhodanobacter sp. MP7CTX1]MBB6188629.1 2-polyprenyl-6-methoxyphenol hydroxylase-like FAD-dependent oxidoreductase [Rhodanobacter sp. MP7CTX1]
MAASTPVPLMIVGAGPTGLSAALFLARRGVPVRIIDAAMQPTTTSKALLVNPRSLEMLKESSVAARIIAEGWAVKGMAMHRGNREVASVDLQHQMPQLPIGLAQARTEALLNDALEAFGIHVERGLSLQALQQDAEQVTLTLQQADGSTQMVQAPLVFGADGARSVVRHALGVDFAGSALPEPWLLWDVRLDTSLDPLRAHIGLQPDGFLFLMHLQAGIWRVIGNGADPLAQLPCGSVPGEVMWQSQFHIAHRVAGKASVGRVALGGDAAHIHSPLGARGMNLGIEDAYVFADCAFDALNGSLERMQEYAELRQPVHREVVRNIAALTRLMRGRPAPLCWLRNTLMPELVKVAPLRHRLLQTMAGLDHPLRTRL